jgi:tRNA-Thr(GGU) m(6)t(6)A37 methyltransferase TsaA
VQAQFTPIGVIENDFAEKVPKGWEAALHQVIIDAQWADALEGVEGFSHLYILFWLHEIPGPRAMRVHPEDRQDLPAVGLFATRTPWRPNPIGLQVVELISRQGTVLTVRGLDALNGTPVLDVKPYLPRGDAIAGARTPEWLDKLWETLDANRR